MKAAEIMATRQKIFALEAMPFTAGKGRWDAREPLPGDGSVRLQHGVHLGEPGGRGGQRALQVPEPPRDEGQRPLPPLCVLQLEVDEVRGL